SPDELTVKRRDAGSSRLRDSGTAPVPDAAPTGALEPGGSGSSEPTPRTSREIEAKDAGPHVATGTKHEARTKASAVRGGAGGSTRSDAGRDGFDGGLLEDSDAGYRRADNAECSWNLLSRVPYTRDGCASYDGNKLSCAEPDHFIRGYDGCQFGGGAE